ncbi:hypothetical protein QLS71_007385 [Mariniflexile litorale]|uniref:Uncharacterized protein n=1 Tax=Mariniflexile litorale TaxID=3045158 RepID=A0AAU7EKC9_9FLAO|nr:hypothetical protein [Mariniflexile sp. KMM 9835]MDQ8211230.1 hypothetical protein [Mariniflexile sp. KMM 9835]
METGTKNTGYTATSAIFDTTAIESPYYETSSIKGTLIDEMKNNLLIIDEPILIKTEVILE